MTRLVPLTLAVLLVHALLLGQLTLVLPAMPVPTDTPSQWRFSTRTLPVETPAPPTPQRPRQPSQKPATRPINKAVTATKIISSPTVDTSPKTQEAEPADDTPDTSTAAVAATATANGVRIPPPARLKYKIKGEVKGIPYAVQGELLWQHDGSSYTARMEISHFLLGARVQTSKGTLTEHGLKPIRFGDKVRSEVAAHFVYEQGKVVFSANTPDAPLQPGAQDQLSIMVQLAALLGGKAPDMVPGNSISFQAVGPRASDTWTFHVGAAEALKLPGGGVSAVRLWRDPSGEYDPKVELWLAPSLGYLPARIRLSQPNGDFVEQQWSATEAP